MSYLNEYLKQENAKYDNLEVISVCSFEGN